MALSSYRNAAGDPVHITIDAPGLSRLHADLKIAQNDVRKQLRKRIGTATIPLRDKIKANAANVPTKQGVGLNKVRTAVRTTQSYSTNGASVKVKVSRKIAPYAAEGAFFRHPLFGNRAYWQNQPTQHEFFDRAVEGEKVAMEAELLHVITDIVAMLARGG